MQRRSTVMCVRMLCGEISFAGKDICGLFSSVVPSCAFSHASGDHAQIFPSSDPEEWLSSPVHPPQRSRFRHKDPRQMQKAVFVSVIGRGV